jgi:hypothetical protein
MHVASKAAAVSERPGRSHDSLARVIRGQSDAEEATSIRNDDMGPLAEVLPLNGVADRHLYRTGSEGRVGDTNADCLRCTGGEETTAGQQEDTNRKGYPKAAM